MRKKNGILVLAVIGFLLAFTLSSDKDRFWFKGGHVSASEPQADEFSIPVLAYHSIANHPRNAYVITQADFEEQMAYLHEQHYESINLEQFTKLMKEKKAVAKKLVLITFDDGYANTYSAAFPILRKYGYTATAFVITDWLGGRNFMSWQQAEKLQQAGWDIMPHSRSHPELPRLSEEQQYDEISGSRAAIELKLHSRADIFAYPYGLRSETTLEQLGNAGFTYAFTFDNGLTSSEQDPLSLKRMVVSRGETLFQFSHRLHEHAME
ncbi:polysaccharide deacetylase family protein [Paenibacillus nasutitermitis]|uniref:NodB homology domain-containing protein n=1 Tax=Paenibacillus nasutitermitis TaxID=1652958 RepID=A0A916YSN4_9BACL|nr:polysaccharide deacetylase family protein [Paenibacillus nasutitermitis]GGD58097.1 hypothetical protein GCM10010911_14870 [Paenibacillus nasutitermitis]